jgi:hypothetical protein
MAGPENHDRSYGVIGLAVIVLVLYLIFNHLQVAEKRRAEEANLRALEQAERVKQAERDECTRLIQQFLRGERPDDPYRLEECMQPEPYVDNGPPSRDPY